MARGIIDATLEMIQGFDACALGGDQPEHRDRAFADEPKRIEAAGAFAVVLQQQTMVLEAREQTFGDGVIVPFAMPLRHHLPGGGVGAARITATDMQSEGHAVEPRNDGVLRLDRAVKVLVGIFAS